MIQNAKKAVISAAVVSALGVTGATYSAAASASLVIDGNYELTISTTPVKTTAYGATSFKIAPPTGLETSFTFGAAPNNSSSQGLTDNGIQVTVTNDFSSFYGNDGLPGDYGTGVAADGIGGKLVFDVVGRNIQNTTAFGVDTFQGTAGGNFAQYIAGGDLSGFGGSIDNNGLMTLAMPGRFGAIDGPTGGVVGPWNNLPNASGGALVGFTTGTTADPGSGAISGVDCSGTGGNYSCTLVSAGNVGDAWGTFTGNPYYEVWNISLTRVGNATVIPVPAAVWLFGSGLLGLVGVARRKKQA
mgnify:FL=1